MRRAGVVVLLLLAACDAEPPVGELDLTVEANPHNTLSFFARWTTEEPATTRVEFGPGGEVAFFVEDTELVTDHEILVFGMQPLTPYDLRAISLDEEGVELGSATTTVETGDVPFSNLVTELTILDEDLLDPGWTLTNILVGTVLEPATAVMFDMEGLPVWYHVQGDELARADLDITFTAEQHVLIGGSIAPGTRVVEVDLAGEIAWEGPKQPLSEDATPPGAMHHTFRKLDNGEYLALLYDHDDDANEWFDVIRQFDADDETVWSWEARDLPLGESSLYAWGNTPLVDLEQDVAYYNTRGHDALYKVDRATGEVLWSLGDGGDFAPDPDAGTPWFEEAHAPEFQPDGHLLMYDNGSVDRGFTRAVEYELDEQAMTARIVWEYPGELADDDWYAVHMGDADRLANGNTLITVANLIDGGDCSRLMEVTADGEKAWEVWLSGEDGSQAGGFAAQRIPVLVGEL